MISQEISKIFQNIALYFEMDGVAFKPQAYEKAAINLETLSEDVKDIYKKGGREALEEIPGVGKNIADKIIEYIKTGKIREYQALKKKIPVNINELILVEGIGPKGVKYLYKKLKIKNLKDLERAAKARKIRNLPNFGEKKEQNILEGIEFIKRSKGRFLLGEILPRVQEIISRLKKLKEIKQISEAGSVRRRKETIGDVDILITTNPRPYGARLASNEAAKKVIDYFVSMPGVVKIWGKGPTKASVRLNDGFDVDLRVLPDRQFGSALQYFTGSKEHNIVLRKIAINNSLKLSEYGLFQYFGSRTSKIGKSDFPKFKMVAGRTEKDIYAKLGMSYIEPELRENTGEIESAIKKSLPDLIGYDDIKGDLHVHSNWDAPKQSKLATGQGSENSIEDLANEAIKMGYQYIGIADHTKFLRIENGLDEKQLIKRNKEIDKLNTKYKIQNTKFKVLKGCETNIMADGSIDIDDKVLAQMDFVIAGIHSQMKMSKTKMTERITRAMRNPNVDIISHPTGRILKKRDEYEVDFDKLLEAAKYTGTILEINAFPLRLDLSDVHIKKAKQAGVKMIINTDAHKKKHLRLMEYGVSQARRGWAEKKDIINAWPLERLIRAIKK
ncbi:DNA polymerase III [Candidatus Wolfebacteria bacterium RBG_13_41_7]|uniref:DNA polymerase beta n=1 Tax=Candidatus Wolfebacteria bacterium RBG_13_41_7 TaxID=1802554 RepID=A0A1F8DNN8_9BACT|nr:MAG: DNA polymerase III [Candidatus Wolfebacteria bacterium RBG_13_41_7]